MRATLVASPGTGTSCDRSRWLSSLRSILTLRWPPPRTSTSAVTGEPASTRRGAVARVSSTSPSRASGPRPTVKTGRPRARKPLKVAARLCAVSVSPFEAPSLIKTMPASGRPAASRSACSMAALMLVCSPAPASSAADCTRSAVDENLNGRTLKRSASRPRKRLSADINCLMASSRLRPPSSIRFMLAESSISTAT